MIKIEKECRDRIKGEKRFWDMISHRYDKFISAEIDEGYKMLLSRIVNDIKTDDIVLDIATGTGIIAFEAVKVAKKVYGIDISQKMIRKAKEKQNDGLVENIEFRLEDGYNTYFEDNVFDVVICCNALHMMKDPGLVLAEIRRVLKCGGVLIAPTYCHAESATIKMRIFLNSMRFMRGIGILPYLHRFKKEDILNIISEGRFTIIEKDEIDKDPILLYIKALRDEKSL